MTKAEMTKEFLVLVTLFEKDFGSSEEKTSLQIEIWTKMFEDIPQGIFHKALMQCVKRSPFPPKVADVTAQIKENLVKPSENIPRMWEYLLDTLDRLADIRADFIYTSVKEGETKSQGELARIKARELFENLPDIFKKYTGSYSGLTQLMKEVAAGGEKGLTFERKVFETFVKNHIEQSTIAELKALACENEKLKIRKPLFNQLES